MKNGRFIRTKGAFSDELGTDVIEGLRRQPGRFCLIASRSCPWSHRTLIVRALKGLEKYVPLQVAGGPRVEGYAVNGGNPWLVPGTGLRIRHLHELYALNDPRYSGRATVPLLWDSRECRIVGNESSAIMRAFDRADAADVDAFTLTPPELRSEIATLNERLYENLFDAVYRAGFARHQAIYEEELERVFEVLEGLERCLVHRRYLFGTTVTDADWRLFPTLVRFDAVYYLHFKCARRRLVDFPNLWAYARDLYAWRDVTDTVDFTAIREGYYGNDLDINPFGIVAVQPATDWTAPHGRERFGSACLALVAGGEVAIDTATLWPLSGDLSWKH
ncbi:MAG: glutathione S-transferase C-terminal domain-containing protein [Gammaproteobacteria bacterium]